MTTTPTPAIPAPAVLRPAWLSDHVWPFPLASIHVDDRPVVYSDTGGSGPVLLFCHAGLWSLLWRDLIAALRDRYRCVTFDPPGSGLSDRLPRGEQALRIVARAAGAIVEDLELRDVTLVLHDLGGLAALAAVDARSDRVAGLVAINTFAWRPHGVLRLALRVFGSAAIRELDAFTGLLPAASSSRLGVGRHFDRATRRAWRAGTSDRAARRMAHRLFRDAVHDRAVAVEAEHALAQLADRPVLTIFGRFGDYFGFQRRWRMRRPDAVQHTVRGGLHFPMCDAPDLVAALLDEFVAGQVRRGG